MDQSAAAELLRQRLGPALAPRLAEQLLRRTDSDPTLLKEILDQVDPSADGLQRVPLRWPPEQAGPILTALHSLSPLARDVVDVGAVIGREFDLAIVERACPGREVLIGLEEAAPLVAQLPGHVFSFRRALTREVCYDELGPRRRAELHERVAEALTALGATSGARAATVVELAYHLGEAAALGGGQRLDAAAAAAATAGATANNEGVFDLAAEYFAQAATFAGRAGWAPGQAGRLMVAAGSARLRAARTHAETQLGRAALSGALRMGMRAEDPGLMAAAALGFGPRPTLPPVDKQGRPVDRPVDNAPVDRERLDALKAALTALGDDADQSVLARLTARLALELDRADLAVRANTLALQTGDPRALAEVGLAIAALTGDKQSLANAQREAAALADNELLARAYDLAGPAGLASLAAMELSETNALVRWYCLRARAALADDANRAAAVALARAAAEVIDPQAAKLPMEVPAVGAAHLGVLTAREREVLTLALRGSSSREIAEALVVGERTIETHLANIYRKLGVASRVELIMRFK